MTRILGIDPGYERLGIAILEKTKSSKEEVLFSVCFKTDKNLEFAQRLKLIGIEVKRVIKKYKPEILAIESLFSNTNQKTVMHVSEARGVIIYEAIQANLKIFEASPPQIKLAVSGDGRASKEQIIKMVKMLVDIDTRPTELRKSFGRDSKTSDDELDAIAIALTAFAYLKK